jgi:hypothetical protein
MPTAASGPTASGRFVRQLSCPFYGVTRCSLPEPSRFAPLPPQAPQCAPRPTDARRTPRQSRDSALSRVCRYP